MNINEFNFELPKELIAQHPSEKRDHSRLLVANYKEQTLEDTRFYDILDYLETDSVLVLNETKVLPARLMGVKKDTHALIEILLLKNTLVDTWEALVKPAKRIKLGSIVEFDNMLKMECIEVKDEGIRVFKLKYEGILIEVLERLGTMPLPPYITEKLTDKTRYQTVYAKNIGSAAAPTAGLHFTKDLLQKISDKGIEIIPITLHVGLGTFRPVATDNIKDHHMHSETYTISEESALALNQAVKNKKRIIACGTTSIRTLESNFKDQFNAGTFDTNIFIYPGYTFKVVNDLITNFHLPKSTLFMLVSTLSSTEFMQKAYHHAIQEKYRFFSFGDAMLIKTK